MSGQARGAEGPDDVDAVFAEIVAGLTGEGGAPTWPERDEAEEPPGGHPAAATALSGPVPSDIESILGRGQRPSDSDRHDGQAAESMLGPEVLDNDHFHPPEPPPLPRLRPGTLVGLALLAIGVLLLVAPGLIGLTSRIGTPLALVAITGGIGWLVLRIRQGPPPDSGWDDGAQL